MAKKRRTHPKNFRIKTDICRWLKEHSVATGISQTRLIENALERTYRMKGRTHDAGSSPL